MPLVLRKLRKGGTTAEAGKYTIVSLLSEHKESTVWLAEHNALHVKRIIKGIRKTSEYHDILVKEAHLLKNLKSPYIPEIYDLTEDNEFTYIIEQYITGESLRSLCNRRLLSEKEILHFMIQFCNIINYLHSFPESILYLDLKPENIIISDDRCYLIDFGSAHYERDDTGPIFGTRSYAPPEQLNGGKLSKASDVFALGKLLDYMLQKSSVLKNRKAMEKLVSRCTANSIWHRIGSVKELMARITEISKHAVSLSKNHIKVAFAGIIPHSGTTYISICLSAFISGLGRKCAYIEANDSEVWYSISSYLSEHRALAGLELLSKKYYESHELPESDLIFDFGTIKKDMPEDFYSADLTCIVAGNMLWETESIHKARALSRNCRNRLFLISPATDTGEHTAKALEGEVFLAIPFIKDFESIFIDEEVKSRMLELTAKSGIYDF